jgi:hypothetical protein
MRATSYAFAAENAFFLIRHNLKLAVIVHIGAICKKLGTLADALVTTDAFVNVNFYEIPSNHGSFLLYNMLRLPMLPSIPSLRQLCEYYNYLFKYTFIYHMAF